MNEDERILKHVKALLVMKTVEVQNDIMSFILISKSYKETINDLVYSRYWLHAIKDEISQLKDNNIYIIEIPPEGTNIVTYKWVFFVKYNENNTVQRFKARLIAREFSQIYDIDYDETFAFTVRINTLRAVLALIAIKNLETEQVDINNVFIESTLKHLIYINAPFEVIVN